MTPPRAPGAGRGRGLVFLGLWAAFALLTAGAVSSTLKHDPTSFADWSGPARVSISALAVLSGPFLGGFARDGQSCCAANSWSLLPYAAAGLGLGVALQFAPWPGDPGSRAGRSARLVAWGAGWFAWFGLGVCSLLHALE